MQAAEERLCDPRDFDSGHKGYLTRHELKCAMTCALGFRPHKSEVDPLMTDGRISYEECEAAFARFAPTEDEVRAHCRRDDVSFAQMLKQTFDAMDVDKRGFLTLDSMERVFGRIKPEVVQATFDELDLSKTGRISYQQFMWIMGAAAHRQQELQRHEYIDFPSGSPTP